MRARRGRRTHGVLAALTLTITLVAFEAADRHRLLGPLRPDGGPARHRHGGAPRRPRRGGHPGRDAGGRDAAHRGAARDPTRDGAPVVRRVPPLVALSASLGGMSVAEAPLPRPRLRTRGRELDRRPRRRSSRSAWQPRRSARSHRRALQTRATAARRERRCDPAPARHEGPEASMSEALRTFLTLDLAPLLAVTKRGGGPRPPGLVPRPRAAR